MKSRQVAKGKSNDFVRKEVVIEILEDDFGNGRSALFDACKSLNIGLTRNLIKMGVDVNRKDHDGTTALNETICSATGGKFAERQKLRIIRELIKAGANINLESEDGYTPLFFAACEGYTTIIKELIDAGANINHVSKTGETVLVRTLHNALILGFRTIKEQKQLRLSKMVATVINSGIDLNFKDDQGDTALISAAKLDHLEAIKLLILNGADITLKNIEKKDFYDYLKVKVIINWVNGWVNENDPEFFETRIIEKTAEIFGI